MARYVTFFLLFFLFTPAICQPETDLNGNWGVFGCFDEFPWLGEKILNHRVTAEGEYLSIDECIDRCGADGWTIAGIIRGGECWCDKTISARTAQQKVSLDACNTQCKTSPPGYTCGGEHSLYIYYATPPWNYPGPDVFPKILSRFTLDDGREFYFTGCDSDSVYNRTLRGAVMYSDKMTPQLCVEYCASRNFRWSGLEWGKECFCGNQFFSPYYIPVAHCDWACSGDSSLACGAANALTVYDGPARAVGPPMHITTSSGRYEGCYIDTVNPRSFGGYSFSSPLMSAELCTFECKQRDYTFAGTEFGKECFCSHTNRAEQADPINCMMPCAGTPEYSCGGSARMNVYKIFGKVPT